MCFPHVTLGLFFVYLVMGNELDKIEQNGTQIAKHPKIPEAAGQLLQKEVKVCFSASWGSVIELHGLLTQECSTYMHSVTRLDTGVMCGYAIEENAYRTMYNLHPYVY